MLRTVDDALRVLEMLAQRGEVTTRDVVAELGRSRSAAYRVIRTLQDRGWATDGGNGTYHLGPYAVVLGMKALSGMSLPAVAGQWLQHLVEETGETATLSTVVGWDRICIDEVESPHQIRMSVPQGQPFPLYAGASGRSILAGMSPARLDDYLAQADLAAMTPNTITDRGALQSVIEADRIRGYSVAQAERDREAFSVAAAIIGRGGVIGSIAVCGPITRFDSGSAVRYGDLVKEASVAISTALGGTER